MAKKSMRVNVVALERYLSGNETIVDVVIFTIENNDIAIFERMRSEGLKDYVLSGVDNMWQQAAEMAKNEDDTLKTKRTIQIVFEDLNHARTCLGLGGCTLYGKISYYWKIFRMKCAKIPLIDVLALHIAEHGNNPEEKEELLMQIKQRITTLHSLNYMFEASDIRRTAPKHAPAGSADYKVDEVPYLVLLCHNFKKKDYKSEQLLAAWETMLDKKARGVNSSKWDGLLEPEDALYVLFEKMNYNEVIRHNKAYHTLIRVNFQ